MKDSVITSIGQSINWLEKNSESDNLLLISQKVSHLQVQSATLAREVYIAYAMMNESEDRYKAAVDKFISEYEGSNAAAEPRARAANEELKKTWTAAKNLYKKMDMILDRIDKISDAYRQQISVVKQAEMKNL